MQAIEVSAGALDIIPGRDQRLLISVEQLADRAHNVTVLKDIGKSLVLVRPERPLQFKRGEQLGLDCEKVRDGVIDVTKGVLAKAAAAIAAEDAEDRLMAELEAKAQAEAAEKAEADAKAAADRRQADLLASQLGSDKK